MARSFKPETLTPMRSPMPPRSHRRKMTLCAGRTVVKKRRSSSTNNAAGAAAASSSEKETPTVVFTEGSPFPSGIMARTATTTTTHHTALSQKLFYESQQDFDENSSPGSKAGQSLEEEEEESANDFDNDNGNYDEEIIKDHWFVGRVQSAVDIHKPNPVLCHRAGCGLVACTIWENVADTTAKPWYYCLDCQEADFGGWPVEEGTGESELPIDSIRSDDWRKAVIEKCTNQDDPTMPALPRSVHDEDDASAASSAGGDKSQEMTAASTQDDSGSEQDMRQLNVIALCQQILDCGVASVCRLRKLFPTYFFAKLDFEGTSVTMFHKENIKRVAYQLNDDGDESYDSEEDEASIVKSIQARTQENLSPLTSTLMSQKPRKYDAADDDRTVYTEKERRLALEALLLIRWMERGGVGTILKDKNLARVVFGIWAPSGESTSDDELIESYSFDLSFTAPENPSEVDIAEAKSGTGSFFQNLNGFKAGPTSLSQLVPSMTQATSAFSQASCYDDGYTQASNYTQSQMSQKSFVASLSLSIRQKAKKNRSIKIPSNRYFSLRVDFVNSVQPHDLPSRLKQYSSAVSRSPVPSNGTMRVTPLGRIRESKFSGLSINVLAHSKQAQSKHVKEGQYNDEDVAEEGSQSSEITSRSRAQALKSQDSRPPTQAENNENEDKENHLKSHEFPLDGVCFGMPCGLEEESDNGTYHPCKIIGHRGKLGNEGQNKMKIKVIVDHEVLEKDGKQKQWLSLDRLVSSSVAGKVESDLRLHRMGLLQHHDTKAIAKKYGVSSAFVYGLMKKHKSNASKRNR